MRLFSVAGLALAVLAGCNQADDRVRFDGEVFRGKASKVRDNPRAFTAWVSPVAASVDGAREAARYEGTKYCIAAYGTSRILWSISPDNEDLTAQIDGNQLNVAGECQP